MNRIILHIDFDSFFASCEQQFNPALRGKALGVTATNGRNCIIAASVKAKRAGIKAPFPVWEARKIIPDISIVPAHFTEYWEISKKFISICKDFSPFIEVFSLDEVFMDVTHTVHLFGGIHPLIHSIKKRLREEIGEYITASVGVSYNKLLAKLASGLKKPNGIVEITKDTLVEIYSQAKLTDICGIGERIKTRLNFIGINTLLDLRNASLSTLVSYFGTIEGTFLKAVGLGIDDSSVVPYTEAETVKSVGRNYCLPKNEYSQQVILQNVYELSEEIGIKLRRLNMQARTIGMSLRGHRSEYGRKTFARLIDSGKEIFEGCVFLYKEWEWDAPHDKESKMVRQISVWASSLEYSDNLQLNLFEDVHKKHSLLSAIDIVNERFGDHTLRNGFLLYADKLTTVPNGFMADRYEREILRTAF